MFTLTAYVGGYVPPIEKAPVAFNNGGQIGNINIPILTPADDAKQFATCQAKAAMAGHVLQRYGDGFIVSRWGHTKEFGTLVAIDAFLNRVVGGLTHD